MFGPNPDIKINHEVSYSHRDTQFINTYRDLKTELSEKFKLADFNIALIPGSATLGIEASIASTRRRIEVIPPKGKFHKRWAEIALRENPLKNSSSSGEVLKLACTLETSSSTYYSGGDICDCVSSFPYYPIPSEAKIFISCSNKQLGGLPGIAIVGIRRGFESLLGGGRNFSVLNLGLHLEYSNLNQTLTTASPLVFKDLLDRVRVFNLDDLAHRIESNSAILCEIFEDSIVGDLKSPAITIPKSEIPYEIASRWQLYGLNSDSPYYQFFTYSGNNSKYLEFAKELSDGS